MFYKQSLTRGLLLYMQKDCEKQVPLMAAEGAF